MAKKGCMEHDSVAMQAMKALVAVYGTREAARVSGIPYGTVSAYAFKYQWKKAAINRPANKLNPGESRDVADVLVAALQKHRDESALHLAEYTARASKKAADHKDPLEVARKVRDVAGVYQVLWPAEEEGGLIEASILIGEAKVTDNPQEMLAITGKTLDVREELSGPGSQSD